MSGVTYDSNQRPLKSAFKPGKQAEPYVKPDFKLDSTIQAIYKKLTASTHDVFTTDVIPRALVRELIAVATREIKARGVYLFFPTHRIRLLTIYLGIKAPFILLAFRPYNYDEKKGSTKSPVNNDEVRSVIEKVFPKGKPLLTGEGLLRVVRLVDVYTLAGVLKWCWVRLPGGVVSWTTYNKFKVDEERAGYKHNAFNSIIDQCVEGRDHKDIIENFFILLVSLAAAEKRNGLNGLKLARSAGVWAFEMINAKKEPPSNFEQGLACWTLAADSCYHMFLAFLRTMYPMPGEMRTVKLPKSLETLLVKETSYPPKKMDYKSRLMKVPKITLSVGRLSASPFVLLQRVAKIIPFESPTQYGSEDDFSTLFYLFSDISDVENRMSPESKRILEEITKENCIFSEHRLNIKETVNLPYDVRAKTWSKLYNHAYINPVTGEPCRPLTNYAYEAHQRQMIINSSMPKSERGALAYPESPTLSSRKPKEKPIGSLDEFNYYYKKSTQDPRFQTESAKDRSVTPDYLATCTLSNISIDDFFVWVWMSTLSQEQNEVSKAVFGRSVVVELQVSEGEAGRRWVVVEEILTPKPSPMKKPKKEPAEKKSVKAAKTEKAEKAEKKPVRFTEPPAKAKILSPIAVRAPRAVSMPSATKDRSIHIHYDNIDPLVAAVAARLKIELSDHETQTDTSRSVQTSTPPPKSTSISADYGNSKGTQTYNYVSAATSTEPSTPPKTVTRLPPGPVLMPSASDIAEIRSIHVSPGPPNEPKPVETRDRTHTFNSYDDVLSAIPYLNASNDDPEADYAVTHISSDAVRPITEAAPLVISKKRSVAPPSPPQNLESFVTSIDTAHNPQRRVVSMPVFHDRLSSDFESSIDGENLSGYRALLEESDDDSLTSRPPVAPLSRSHRHSNSSLMSSQRTASLGGMGLYQGPNMSAHPAAASEQLPRSTQVQDESLFDHSSDDYAQPRNVASKASPLARPLPRPGSPPSANSSNSSIGSNLRGNWGYGRNSSGPLPPAVEPGRDARPTSWGPGQQSRDPRDPRTSRDFRPDPRGRPQPGPPVMRGGMRDPRQIPRDFQQQQQPGPEFDSGVGRGYPRPFFAHSEGPSANNSMSPPGNRYVRDSGSQQSPRGVPPAPALPTVDDMMMESGPMPGGARSTKLPFTKPSRPNHSSGASAFSGDHGRQPIPTTYHSSPDNLDKAFGGYGSDSNYRYDPSERPKDSPDSGFANPPSLANQQQQMRQLHYRGGSGSDSSDGSYGNRQRANSNSREYGLPPPVGMGAGRQQQPRHASNPEIGQQSQPQQSLQFRPVSEIKAPQPRSSVAPSLFAESPLKSVSSSTIHEPRGVQRINSTAASVVSGSSSHGSQNLSSSLPRHSDAVAAPPVVSTVHASSEPLSGHSFLGSGATAFEDGGIAEGSSSSVDKTSPFHKLPAVMEDSGKPGSGFTLVGSAPTASGQLHRHVSQNEASSNYSEERSSEGSSNTHDFATAFVPSETQTRELFDYSPPRRRESAAGSSIRNDSPNFPHPTKFDPLNEQSIMRATKLNLLRPDAESSNDAGVAVAKAQDEEIQARAAGGGHSRKPSKFSMAGFLDAARQRKAKK